MRPTYPVVPNSHIGDLGRDARPGGGDFSGAFGICLRICQIGLIVRRIECCIPWHFQIFNTNAGDRDRDLQYEYHQYTITRACYIIPCPLCHSHHLYILLSYSCSLIPYYHISAICTRSNLVGLHGDATFHALFVIPPPVPYSHKNLVW